MFGAAPAAPLAERLRPTHLGAVIGPSHLIGPGRSMRLAFESGTPHSMILWGSPGVGKTTLARLAASALGHVFIAWSAVFAGVKEIRTAMGPARHSLAHGKKTMLFVDEIHRCSKAVKSCVNQQPAKVIVQMTGLPRDSLGARHA